MVVKLPSKKESNSTSLAGLFSTKLQRDFSQDNSLNELIVDKYIQLQKNKRILKFLDKMLFKMSF